MRHFAYVPRREGEDVTADLVSEWQSRLEADRAAVRLLNGHGDGVAVLIEGALADGDVVPPDAYFRRTGHQGARDWPGNGRLCNRRVGELGGTRLV